MINSIKHVDPDKIDEIRDDEDFEDYLVRVTGKSIEQIFSIMDIVEDIERVINTQVIAEYKELWPEFGNAVEIINSTLLAEENDENITNAQLKQIAVSLLVTFNHILDPEWLAEFNKYELSKKQQEQRG